MTGDLWVFACGRSLTPASRASAAMMVEIVLESVEVDEKGGRVDLVDWSARLGGRRLKHGAAQAAIGRVVIESSRKLSRM